VNAVVTEEQLRQELRVPLEVIQACAQVLREHWDELSEEERAVVLGQIEHAAKRHGESLDELERRAIRERETTLRERFRIDV
jgi:signal transduction histidine kinase